MYDYGYPDYNQTSGILGAFALIGGVIWIVGMIGAIILIIAQWKIYKKAGKKGWEVLVPVYNFIVLLEIVELPMWYIVLFFIPFANIYAMFKIYIELAHKFGKSTGFGVLTIFFSFICIPILGFSKNCVYNGNNTNNMTQQNNQEMNNNNIGFQNQFNNVENNNFNNNLNNNVNNTQNNDQPFMFNQNINTEITPINPVPTVHENNLNNITPEPNIIQQSNMEVPLNNIQPELNQNMNNVVPTTMPTSNEPNGFKYEIPNQSMEAEQPTPVVSMEAQPVPTNNMMQNNAPSQPINVIPGMGQPIEPQPQQPENIIPGQNNINPNM